MQVDVFLTAQTVSEDDVKGRTAVVLDIFRASSTIVTALDHGARAVVPVADMADAGKIAAALDPASYVLGGERGGIKIEGYHHGNSPFEYTHEAVSGKTVIFNTSNGTRALTRAKTAEHLLVGCFLNAKAIVDAIREAGNDLVLVCAGSHNQFALEDALCAGLLLHRLWDGQEPGLVSDAAHMVFSLYTQDKHTLKQTLMRSNHGQRLVGLGYEADVPYCIQQDTTTQVPVYRDNRLCPLHG
ncbi:MAG: 2-phosphosulfolactate phosphatase [Rhodothermales bacterium]